MNYPYKSVTDAGVNLLSTTVGNKNNNLIIDNMILSDEPISNSNNLHLITVNDFKDPLITGIDTVARHGNTLQPNATIYSTNFRHSYNIYMIGLIAHTTLNTNPVVYAVVMAKNHPFTMPSESPDELDFTISMPTSFANTNNVQVVTIDNDYSKLLQYEQKTDNKLAMIIKDMKNNPLKGMKLGEIKD